jgi:hypothetical protein
MAPYRVELEYTQQVQAIAPHGEHAALKMAGCEVHLFRERVELFFGRNQEAFTGH